MENLFFELVQVALGQREKLSHVLSEQEWTKLFVLSKKQAVAGVTFEALDRLSIQGVKPPQQQLRKWMVTAQYIKKRNTQLDSYCRELLGLLSQQGIEASILKGQGIACYYNENLRSLRQSGDIDVYVDCEIETAMAFAKAQGQENIEWDYKHLSLKLWNNVEVEMHYRVEVLLNLIKNKRLQRWFNEHKDLLYRDIDGLLTPTTEFNVFYILLHIYRHFLYRGIGLRQILDYYFVLKEYSGSDSSKVALEAVKSFGMVKFAQGLMWLMKETLGMPSEWMPWEPNQKEGTYILEQVMMGGNFGHHDKRLQRNKGKIGAVLNVIKHNLHLLRHYPSDTLWAPIWIVWHKLWKIKTNALRASQQAGRNKG